MPPTIPKTLTESINAAIPLPDAATSRPAVERLIGDLLCSSFDSLAAACPTTQRGCLVVDLVPDEGGDDWQGRFISRDVLLFCDYKGMNDIVRHCLNLYNTTQQVFLCFRYGDVLVPVVLFRPQV